MTAHRIAIASLFMLGGCAASSGTALADRPLLSVETRLACPGASATAEAPARGPRRGYDGEAMPSAPAPARVDDAVGVTPQRSCEAGEQLAALMLAMPDIAATVDAAGQVALVEAEASVGARRPASAPPVRAAPPPPVNRAAEAAARAAASAATRARPPR